MKNKKIKLYICILAFGLVGIYLTFFFSNTNKYDSKIKAYDIYPNEVTSSDGSMYYPIYRFIVNDKEYECKTKSGSNITPKESKNMVYYDSANPENCMTQYDESNGKVLGIVFIFATIVIIYVFIIKKPDVESNVVQYQMEEPIDSELVQKVDRIMDTAQLVYKRVVLVIIIIILIFLILVDTAIFKQTLKARNYIDATATYVNVNYGSEHEYIYTFNDKDGNSHEIVLNTVMDPSIEMKIKYNENNPEDYYDEGALLNKAEFVWYIVKVILVVLLTILFFNKDLLNRIGMSVSKE